MRQGLTLSPSRQYFLSYLLILSVLVCQFLGFQHGVHHSLIKTSLSVSDKYFTPQLIDSDNIHPSTSDIPGIEHHCAAWDHATLSFGVLSDSVYLLDNLFSFVKIPLFGFYFQPARFIQSYLSRAPPSHS
jgi:hypothetical protein